MLYCSKRNTNTARNINNAYLLTAIRHILTIDTWRVKRRITTGLISTQ